MENQRLTPHFNLADFLASDTALKCDICNDPHTPDVVAHLRLVAEKLLEPVQARFYTRPQITSGYRCPQLNGKVGGSATSQHMQGRAVDFQLPGVPLLEVARWMAEALDYDQLFIERGQEVWIHASYVSPENNRRKLAYFDGSQWHDGLPEAV